MPKARNHLAVVAAGGSIHAIGGRITTSIDRTDQHDIYDPKTNSWSDALPLLTPRSGLPYVLYRGIIGGELPLNTLPRTKRSIQGQRVGDTSLDAGRPARHQRRSNWQQPLCCGRLAEAGSSRNRSVDRVHIPSGFRQKNGPQRKPQA